MAAASTPSTPETARAGSEMPSGKAATTAADMAVAMAPVTAVAMAEGAVVAAGISGFSHIVTGIHSSSMC